MISIPILFYLKNKNKCLNSKLKIRSKKKRGFSFNLVFGNILRVLLFWDFVLGENGDGEKMEFLLELQVGALLQVMPGMRYEVGFQSTLLFIVESKNLVIECSP